MAAFPRDCGKTSVRERGGEGTASQAVVVPPSDTRPPATHVPTILFVLGPELLAQRRLLVKDHEKMHAEGKCYDGCDRYRVGMPEHNPQPDSADCEAQVHGAPHVAVETHHDQSLRRSDRGRRAVSRPPEVPTRHSHAEPTIKN
jgi:hypothetical protein